MDTVWTDETIAQRQSKFRWMFEEPFWLALITGNYAEYGKEDIEKEARSDAKAVPAGEKIKPCNVSPDMPDWFCNKAVDNL